MSDAATIASLRRTIARQEAEAEEKTSEDIVQRLFDELPVP